MHWIKITDGHTEDIYTYGQFGGEPMQKYHGRTSVPGDGFATGNVSLTLKNVQPADEGMYSCIVTSRDWSADTSTKLSTAGWRLPELGRKGGKLLQREKSSPKGRCPPADAASYDPTHHLPTPAALGPPVKMLWMLHAQPEPCSDPCGAGKLQ